jgi:hypothetical protein
LWCAGGIGAGMTMAVWSGDGDAGNEKFGFTAPPPWLRNGIGQLHAARDASRIDAARNDN